MKSGAHKRKIVFAAVGLCVAILAAVAFWPGEKEPEEFGSDKRKLSAVLDNALYQPHGNEYAREEVRVLGKKGIPFYVKWATHSQRRERRARIARNLPSWAQKTSLVTRWLGPEYGTDKLQRGRIGFEIIGTNGTSAIPDLRKFAEDPDPNIEPIAPCICIAYTGPEGVSKLVEILRNGRKYPKRQLAVLNAFRFVTYVGSNAKVAIPGLVECVNSTNRQVGLVAMEILDQWYRNYCHEYDTPTPPATDAAVRMLIVESLKSVTNSPCLRLAVTTAQMAARDDWDKGVRTGATNVVCEIEAKIKAQGGDHL